MQGPGPASCPCACIQRVFETLRSDKDERVQGQCDMGIRAMGEGTRGREDQGTTEREDKKTGERWDEGARRMGKGNKV